MRHWMVVICLLCLIPGCGAQEKIPMQGTLIYERGNKLHAFDLAIRTSRPLIDWFYHHGSPSLAGVDGEQVLVDTAGDYRIHMLNLRTLKTTDLREGKNPLYMPRHRKFFFKDGDRKIGLRLFLADLGHPEAEVREIAPDEGEFSSMAPLVRISDDEVVFKIRGDGGTTPPYRYNLVTGALEQLPAVVFGKYLPYAWRSASSQLICSTYEGEEHYLVSLDGSRVEPMDFLYLLPLAYSEKQDILIVNIPTMGWMNGTFMLERYDLWAYSFKTGRRERLAKGIAPGVGGLVWLE
ncbi:hypothetical protein [Nitrosovibrio sp. Nv17]|uniref:hypothetical protein n=1 Tax=Nitrosovibrio sp. Nv17 TaxID=1855339 RepID=UPI000909021A|nr:hypothetical protein [Nitrosovibrio sp. Nv17]SFW11633.1 hypothetical protein SAMN05216414_101287 [Nitrosovibrio sp. Nv17]